MNSTNLTYHGFVELQLKNKSGKTIKKIIKNEGTTALFKVFAKALAGNYDNYYTPKTVGVFKKSNNSYILLGKKALISGLVYVPSSDVLDQPHTKLTAFIPYDSSYSEPLPDGESLYLLLFPDSSEVLARISLVGSGIEQMSVGLSFIINWYLYIDNVSTNETNGGNE